MSDETDRSEQLLEELESIIVTEGFSGLKMGLLATHLRCSRTTLYKLASSKDELVLMVLNRVGDASFAEASEAAADPGLTQAERITRWIEAVSRWQTHVSNTCWRDVAAWEPSATMFARRSDRAVGILSGFIDEGIRTGEFRAVNGRFAAELLSRGSRATRDPVVLDAAGLTSGEAAAELGKIIVAGLIAC